MQNEMDLLLALSSASGVECSQRQYFKSIQMTQKSQLPILWCLLHLHLSSSITYMLCSYVNVLGAQHQCSNSFFDFFSSHIPCLQDHGIVEADEVAACLQEIAGMEEQTGLKEFGHIPMINCLEAATETRKQHPYSQKHMVISQIAQHKQQTEETTAHSRSKIDQTLDRTPPKRNSEIPCFPLIPVGFQVKSKGEEPADLDTQVHKHKPTSTQHNQLSTHFERLDGIHRET